MEKWEYKKETYWTQKPSPKELSLEGKRGWEVVEITGRRGANAWDVIFKRRVNKDKD